VQHKLKIPQDLVEDENDYDMDLEDMLDQAEEEGEEEGDEMAGKESDVDVENEVFAMARENKEMVKEGRDFANVEMNEKINKIEDEMMDTKKWQMKGEVQCKDRQYNSLLEEFVDFDTATKLPPQITQETTNAIEAIIK